MVVGTERARADARERRCGRPILDEAFEIFGDKIEFVVALPSSLAASHGEMGWKNANLRSEMFPRPL